MSTGQEQDGASHAVLVSGDEVIARVMDRLAATQETFAQVQVRDMSSTPAEWARWFRQQAAAIRAGEVPGWLHGLVGDLPEVIPAEEPPTVAYISATQGPTTEYLLAERVAGGWQSGARRFADADVTSVEPVRVIRSRCSEVTS